MELLIAPGGTVEVGDDGVTSLRCEGGFLRSVFQIADPQGKAEGWPGARPMADGAGCDPQEPGPVSPEGVLGCDAVGDMEPLAMEPLRGRAKVEEDVSLSHEDRRTGFCGCAGG